MHDRMPNIGEQVVLANLNRMRSFEQFGCVKDIGVLCDYGDGRPHWTCQGNGRAMTLESFTHWMPLQEPVNVTELLRAMPLLGVLNIDDPHDPKNKELPLW